MGLRYYTDDQEAMESGGHQFGPDGKTLVGHYPDGSMPPPALRAYGRGQMQIRTAMQTAEKHGIPWDERKFMTDGDYNVGLADKHKGDLLQHYGGDETKARAAYYSGQGTVDAAIAKYGSDFGRGLGPNGQKYIGYGGSGVADVTQKQPSSGERAGMSGNIFDVADPFNLGPTVSKEVEETQVRAGRADSVLQDAIGVIDAIQPQREAALKTTVAAKTEINKQMRDQTQNLIERAKPLFQKREAIAARQRELLDMNPVERFFKGTFNPNYNDKDLRARDYAAKNELDVLGSDYDYISKLNDSMTRLVSADLDNQDSIWRLQSENASQDVQLAFQAAQSSTAVLSSSMQGLESQTSLLRAQAGARKQTLDSLTIGQINAGLDQAQKSENGMAIINGVPISQGDLKQAQFGFEEQEYNAQARKMAMESGQIEMADKAETRLIDHMPAQVMRDTIAAGGVYQGQQLSTTKLTQALGSRQAQDAAAIDQITTNSSAGQALGVIKATGAVMSGTNQRMVGLFGKLPDAQTQLLTHASIQLQAYADGQTQANKAGLGKQYAAENAPKIATIIAAQHKIVDDSAKLWSGGDKDLEAVASAWLRGQPLSGSASVRGMIRMARTGAPAGTHLSGPALESFRRVQALVQQNDSPKAGQKLDDILQPTGKGPTKEEKENQLIQKVQGVVTGVYNARLTKEILAATPQISRGVMVNGHAHPFSQVNPSDFSDALAHGDQEGVIQLARENNMKPDDFIAALNQGASGPLGAKSAQIGAQLTARQTSLTMQAMDVSPSARPGFRPSKAWADLMNQPAFQDRVAQVASASKSQTFGDYLTSTIAGPGFNDRFLSYAQSTRQAYLALNRTQLAAKTAEQQSIAGDPWTRANAVLSAIDNIAPNEAKVLLSAIRPLIQSNGPPGLPPSFEKAAFGVSATEAAQTDEFDQIHNIINNHKFADPALEQIRKRAATQWAPNSDIVSRIFQGIRGY